MVEVGAVEVGEEGQDRGAEGVGDGSWGRWIRSGGRSVRAVSELWRVDDVEASDW